MSVLGKKSTLGDTPKSDLRIKTSRLANNAFQEQIGFVQNCTEMLEKIIYVCVWNIFYHSTKANREKGLS